MYEDIRCNAVVQCTLANPVTDIWIQILHVHVEIYSSFLLYLYSLTFDVSVNTFNTVLIIQLLFSHTIIWNTIDYFVHSNFRSQQLCSTIIYHLYCIEYFIQLSFKLLFDYRTTEFYFNCRSYLFYSVSQSSSQYSVRIFIDNYLFSLHVSTVYVYYYSHHFSVRCDVNWIQFLIIFS
jgi:hypothetical protein